MSHSEAMTEVLLKSAHEQARLLADGALSAERLVSLYAERITRLNPTLHAFVFTRLDRALDEAHRIDRRRAQGKLNGAPFLGVPIGIKDLNLVRGLPCKLGSRAYQWLWSPIDDAVVARIRRAGFIIVGKLATSELGVMPITEPDIHPPTRNPFSFDHSPGGSSGGSGAAVAADLLPLAHGSDGAGSVRIPAALCHLVGWKPSRGRLPHPHRRTDVLHLTSEGALARSVEDAARLVAVMADELVAPPARPAALKIRYTLESPLCTTEPEIAAATLRAVEALRAEGHHVEEGAPPEGTLADFLPIWQGLAANIPSLSETRLQPVTRWMRQQGKHHHRHELAARFRRLAARAVEWFGDADLWVTPTVPVFAPKVGAYTSLEPEQAFTAIAPLGAFTALFNITGQPAVSLPSGLSAEGLPMGVQLAGRVGADAQVIDVARQLEAALPFASRRAAMAVQA